MRSLWRRTSDELDDCKDDPVVHGRAGHQLLQEPAQQRCHPQHSLAGQRQVVCKAESIEWFVEDQAFLLVVWVGSSPTPFSGQQSWPGIHRKTVKYRQFAHERGGKGVGKDSRSRITRPQESLALYKSFNTLCLKESFTKHFLFSGSQRRKTEIMIPIPYRLYI